MSLCPAHPEQGCFPPFNVLPTQPPSIRFPTPSHLGSHSSSPAPYNVNLILEKPSYQPPLHRPRLGLVFRWGAAVGVHSFCDCQDPWMPSLPISSSQLQTGLYQLPSSALLASSWLRSLVFSHQLSLYNECTAPPTRRVQLKGPQPACLPACGQTQIRYTPSGVDIWPGGVSRLWRACATCGVGRSEEQ